jgi:hypothetical protein
MGSDERKTPEKPSNGGQTLNKCSGKLTGISDVSVIIWGILVLLLFVGIAVTQCIEVSQLEYQTTLRLALNDIHRREAFSSILNGIDPSNPASHAVAVAQLQNLSELGEYEKHVLFQLADSKEYFAAKVAIHALVALETEDRLRLIKRFWRLCKMACDRGDYHKDTELLEIYQWIEPHLEDTLKRYILRASEKGLEAWAAQQEESPENKECKSLSHDQSFLEGPYPWEYSRQLFERLVRGQTSISREQAQMYVDSYQIFEVITYFTMLLTNQTALSGLYSQYDPTTLNLHFQLYRWVTGHALFPDFFSGTERAMYSAVTSDDGTAYREIWKALYSRDQFLEGDGMNSLLFKVNHKGLGNTERKVAIVCSETHSGNLPEMIGSLLEKHPSIKVDLLDRTGLRHALSYHGDPVHQLSCDGFRHLDGLLFVTLDKEALDAVASEIAEADRRGPDTREKVQLIAFLPIKDKMTVVPGKLTFEARRIVEYNPENPFKSDNNLLDAIRKEFRDLVLGKE